MFTINGRTQSQQAFAHADACMEYAREALAEGRIEDATQHVNAAENWTRMAREI